VLVTDEIKNAGLHFTVYSYVDSVGGIHRRPARESTTPDIGKVIVMIARKELERVATQQVVGRVVRRKTTKLVGLDRLSKDGTIASTLRKLITSGRFSNDTILRKTRELFPDTYISMAAVHHYRAQLQYRTKD
jgi:hypothetical protein